MEAHCDHGAVVSDILCLPGGVCFAAMPEVEEEGLQEAFPEGYAPACVEDDDDIPEGTPDEAEADGTAQEDDCAGACLKSFQEVIKSAKEELLEGSCAEKAIHAQGLTSLLELVTAHSDAGAGAEVLVTLTQKFGELLDTWRLQGKSSPLYALDVKYRALLNGKLANHVPQLLIALKTKRFSAYTNPEPFATATSAAKATDKVVQQLVTKLNSLVKRGAIEYQFSIVRTYDGQSLLLGTSPLLRGVHKTMNTVKSVGAHVTLGVQAQRAAAHDMQHDPVFSSLDLHVKKFAVRQLLNAVLPGHKKLYPFSGGQASLDKLRESGHTWWPDIPFKPTWEQDAEGLLALFEALVVHVGGKWQSVCNQVYEKRSRLTEVQAGAHPIMHMV